MSATIGQALSPAAFGLFKQLPYQHMAWIQAMTAHTSGLFLIAGQAESKPSLIAEASLAVLGPSASYIGEIQGAETLDEALTLAEAGNLVIATIAAGAVDELSGRLRMFGADLNRVEAVTRAAMAVQRFFVTGIGIERAVPIWVAEIMAFAPDEPATALIIGRSPTQTIQDTAINLMHHRAIDRNSMLQVYGSKLAQMELDSAMAGHYPRTGQAFPTVPRRPYSA